MGLAGRRRHLQRMQAAPGGKAATLTHRQPSGNARSTQPIKVGEKVALKAGTGREAKTKPTARHLPKAGKKLPRTQAMLKVGRKAGNKQKWGSGVAKMAMESGAKAVKVSLLLATASLATPRSGSRATLRAMLRKKALASSVAPQLLRKFTSTPPSQRKRELIMALGSSSKSTGAQRANRRHPR